MHEWEAGTIRTEILKEDADLKYPDFDDLCQRDKLKILLAVVESDYSVLRIMASLKKP